MDMIFMILYGIPLFFIFRSSSLAYTLRYLLSHYLYYYVSICALTRLYSFGGSLSGNAMSFDISAFVAITYLYSSYRLEMKIASRSSHISLSIYYD